MWRCPSLAETALAALMLAAAAPGRLAAQEAPPQPPAAVARWLATDEARGALFDTAVADLLADPAQGFAWLGDARQQEQPPPRAKQLDALLQHAVVEFVRRQRASGMRFAGQYRALEPLQPRIGEFLFELLLDTPAWFPHSHRARLVPALRDLYPHAPGDAVLGRVLALAENEALEPEPLRTAVACLLWQWNERGPAQRRLDRLRSESAEGDAEDRVRVLLELAELQYELREHKAAAATHRSVAVMANAAGLELRPIDHYQSACNHALIGDVERGLAALAACAELQASPAVDSSLKLARSLFDRDPEIASLRSEPRYAAIVARAFPAPPADGPR